VSDVQALKRVESGRRVRRSVSLTGSQPSTAAMARSLSKSPMKVMTIDGGKRRFAAYIRSLSDEE
jgi:hypothetical protein